MKFFVIVLIFLILTPLSAREIAKDINDLQLMDTFKCQASHKVEYRSGKKTLKKSKYFKIPAEPGGYMKFHNTKLNMLFEAHFTEAVHFSLKQLNAYKNFPYKMKKKTDKKTFVKVEIRSQEKKPVFTLNCKKI